MELSSHAARKICFFGPTSPMNTQPTSSWPTTPKTTASSSAQYLKAVPSPCSIDLAENGEIALAAKMQSGHYDLVLMDAHMPVMDGYTATRAMRFVGGI